LRIRQGGSVSGTAAQHVLKVSGQQRWLDLGVSMHDTHQQHARRSCMSPPGTSASRPAAPHAAEGHVAPPPAPVTSNSRPAGPAQPRRDSRNRRRVFAGDALPFEMAYIERVDIDVEDDARALIVVVIVNRRSARALAHHPRCFFNNLLSCARSRQLPTTRPIPPSNAQRCAPRPPPLTRPSDVPPTRKRCTAARCDASSAIAI
jgi:hypothetical protein